MLKYLRISAVSALVILALSLPVYAQLSGAIFTTDVNGAEVNGNIYTAKTAVYLSGGPPPGAPAGAAGLPDGTYIFQVTDPSGKVLLSTDDAKCREVTVSGGNISGVVVTGCQHATGKSVDGEVTVQLMPYADTPNNGGEYKAWMTPLASYENGCSALGVADGLDTVDCGYDPPDFHGFIASQSKTDNFKVKSGAANLEIDTRFYDQSGNLILGLCEIWIDTLGVSNTICSEQNLLIGNPGLAHIEDPEVGVNQVVIYSQPGCTDFTGGVSQYIGQGLQTTQTFVGPGPVTVDITIKNNTTGSIVIDVYCN